MSGIAISPASTVAIAGAGSVGFYVGGRLASAGRSTVFLGRPAAIARVRQTGLRLSDTDGGSDVVSPEMLRLSTDPAILAEADVILVTVKSGGTRQMATLIARHAPAHAVVVSLQNGLDNADVLSQGVGSRRVVPAMVPFNIVQLGDSRFHRGTSGTLAIAAGRPGLARLLRAPGLPVVEEAAMAELLWGKLLLNLNNGLNALSGLPLREELGDRRWRSLLADAIAEGLQVAKAAGIRPRLPVPIPPAWLPAILRLPTTLFRVVAARMLRVDPEARSSMWDDLECRRPTEVDALNGAIVARAAAYGVAAPVNAAIVGLVQAAERTGKGSPLLFPAAIRRA